MPRQKRKVYLYSPTGLFLKEYESLTEFYNNNTEGKKIPVFNINKSIGRMSGGCYVSYTRLGRDGVRNLNKILNDPLSKNVAYKGEPYHLKNALGEIVATFKSFYVAKELLPINEGTLSHHKEGDTTFHNGWKLEKAQ